MAANTASFAAGEELLKKADEAGGKIPGRRKRRTVWLNQQPRPLYVAEAEFKAAKVFTRVKKALLVLYGTELLVVDVAALEAAESGSGDASVGVLRFISYMELLEVSLCGAATLKIEFGDSTDKPKIMGMAMLEAMTAGGGSSSNAGPGGGSSSSSSGDPNSSNLGTNSIPQSEAYSTAGLPPTGLGSSSSPGAGAASMRVTYNSFTLSFKDPAIAQEAAAALLFQRAQYAAAWHWLYQGLHAGFRCEPVNMMALPLSPEKSSSLGGSASIGGSRGRLVPGPKAAGAGVGAAGQANPPYPWGSVSAGWGCSIPLPASWQDVLAPAAATAERLAAEAADEPEVTMDDLSCPVDLLQGPEALQLTFSTPLGVAKALITPQHVKAALLNSQCRQILAVPAQMGLQQQHHRPAAGFSWTVTSRVPAGTTLEGSSGNLAGAAVLGVASSAPSAASLFETSNHGASMGGAGVAAAAAAGAAGGFTANHTIEVFAAVTVEVVSTPHKAGRRGAGRVYDPQAAAAPAAAAAASSGGMSAVGEAATPAGSSLAGDVVSGSSSSNRRGTGGAAAAAGLAEKREYIQLAVLGVMLAVAAMQLGSNWSAAVLQLLLIAALAGLSMLKTDSSSSSSGMEAAAAAAQLDPFAGSEGSFATPANSAGGAAAAAGNSPFAAGAAASLEDVTCCGWSLKLVTGDVLATPGRYLQLQISMARADKGLTALRQRMASASLSFGGSMPPLSMTAGVPVLVSDPEPAWLNPDTKQRFLNAKPTLEASQEQAKRTHRWRQRMGIDSVLTRPCPGFEAISATFPTYTLLDNSPDGHAVVMMKVGAIKDLCDLVFNPPPGTQGVTLEQVEQTLAVLNEYLVQVSAPNLLPAGFQVQVYDMAGFKLSYVMGDMLTLFKLLVRFGHYYPERLHQALVINAPAWFSYPWKLMSAFLDANTSAKVVVVGSPKFALSSLVHHMGGIDNVPVAWGGNNTTPLDEFPAHKRMVEFARRLNAGEQPLQDVQQQQTQLQAVGA